MTPNLLSALKKHPFVAEFRPGDELDWSAVLPNAGKHFQARALRPVTALAFEGGQLLESFKQHPDFGGAILLRLLGVVSDGCAPPGCSCSTCTRQWPSAPAPLRINSGWGYAARGAAPATGGMT